MTKHLFAFALLASLFFNSRAQLSFTVSSQSGSFNLTCANPTLTLFVMANTTNSLQCTWVGPASTTVTGNPQSFASTGNYTVMVTDVITNSTSIQTFIIGQDFQVPQSSVSPASQIIYCTNPSSATFSGTAISPTINIVHEWYSPGNNPPAGPVSYASSGSLSMFTPFGVVGTYTYILRNVINGCTTSKTVNVTSTAGFPTFQSNSTTNYSLGCVPLNQTTLCISNVVSASSVAQFAFLQPGSASSPPLPSGSFGAQSCTATPTPGSWTLVVLDPINSCQAAMPVIITQNTFSPTVFASMNTRTITCNTPTVIAIGNSFQNNTQINWIVPSTPSVVANPTVVIGAPTGPSVSPTSTVYANYTVVATNTVNACQTTSVITINQNFRAPIPQLAPGSASVITCSGAPVILSYTGTAGGSGVIGATTTVISWLGPPPQASASIVSTYSAYAPGVYTLTTQDSYNGCYGSKTYFVIDQRLYPSAAVSFSTDCSVLMTIVPSFTGSTSGLSYSWTAPPGASILTSGNTQTVSVNGLGIYTLTISNNANYCVTTDTYNIAGCTSFKINSAQENNIRLYPIPASKNLNIVFDNAPVKTELQIFDIQGKLMMAENLKEKNNSVILDLNKGFYSLKIVSEGRAIKTEKLIIE